MISSILHSNLLIKIRNWEHWPFYLVHAPLFPYWLWLSLKARSLVFFSASNPGILMGGMFGESKFEILEKVSSEFKPKTILVDLPTTVEGVRERMTQCDMRFPVIFKPDQGERGWMVKKICNEVDVGNYLTRIKISFLIQEFLDLPHEFGVFYIRYPSETTGRVTSIVGKEMLAVEGDGSKTLRQLILEKDRAKLHWDSLQVVYRDRLDEIIARGANMELVSIGNHCLGTKFLNKNHLITDALSSSFDTMSKRIDGFYFGRFDLRAASENDLEQGKVMVMELNGCGAEPSHIYHPGFSLLEGMRILFKHWSDIYRVSMENHKLGVPFLPAREAKMIYKKFRALTAAE